MQKKLQHYEEQYKNNPLDVEIIEKLTFHLGEAGEYKRAIELLPDALINKKYTINTIYWYGLASMHICNQEKAIQAFCNVIERDKKHLDAYKNLAFIYLKKGKLEYAENLLRKALTLNDKDLSVIEALIEIQNITENFEQAINYLGKLIKQNPNRYELLSDKAFYLNKLGKYSEAVVCLKKIITANPEYIPGWINLNISYNELNQYKLALDAIDRAINLNEKISIAWSNKANTLIGMTNYEEAIDACKRAIAIDDKNASAYTNMALAFFRLNQNSDGLILVDKALQIQPKMEKAWIIKANYFLDKQQYRDSLYCCDMAIQLNQKMIEPLLIAANCYQELKNYNQVNTVINRCIELQPKNPKIQVRSLANNLTTNTWENFSEQVLQVKNNVENNEETNIMPLTGLSIFGEEKINQKISENFCKYYKVIPEKKFNYSKKNKIRVAYFSYDFRDHAVYHLIRNIFNCHNKEQFEIYAFKLNHANTDENIEKELKNNFLEVIEIADMQHKDVENILKDYEIDIAIDLGGHTKGSALPIFSQRIAPIQINYLGYPGTSGAKFMDYIIADATVIPEENREFYTEKIIYLPNSYQPNDFKKGISNIQSSRQDMGLDENSFVYCCFNNSYKINPKTFDSWMNILHQVKNGILWLLEDNEINSNNLRKEAKNRGINPERIVFAKRINLRDHLARHAHADLFLDTLPYNAHTTASDALWTGLPVLTLKGNNFAGRVAASLLTAINMPELVTQCREEYEAKAILFAKEKLLLSQIKTKLNKNRITSPLFNTATYTKYLEMGLLEAYKRYHSGKILNHIFIH